MKINISIEIDNAAFTDNEGAETARILRALAQKIAGEPSLSGLNSRLFDENGNRVGQAVATKR